MKEARKHHVQQRRILQAIKIALGSSAAIWLASLIGLEYATSAGSIALLTIVTTKWETVRLSIFRILSFAFSAAIAALIFTHVPYQWFSYGLYIFLVVIICEELGMKATISVNAVVGMHFLDAARTDASFICNEFLLVVIGITIALFLNLFYDYAGQHRNLRENIRYTEQKLQRLLRLIADYLTETETVTASATDQEIWDELKELDTELHMFVDDAYEYQDNTFQSHPGYYIDYFEMRREQVQVLQNLHSELGKIRSMPKQAQIIADYIRDMAVHVIEINEPTAQLNHLQGIFDSMRREVLPVSREEFESRAILYHILMDLEEFLIFKKRFVQSLDSHQLERYWNRHS